MKPIAILLSLCLVLLLAAAPAVAQSWDVKATINAAYIAQETLDESGEEVTEFVLGALTGIEFWRSSASSDIGFGFSLELAGLPDEEQRTPRIVPGFAFHIGSEDLQGFGGVLLDSQDENGVVVMFGITAAFG